VARSQNGEAISSRRKTRAERERLEQLLVDAQAIGDLATWKRAKAVRGYVEGGKVIALAKELGITRGAINRWLQWYEAGGAEGLRTNPIPGSEPRLTEDQRSELSAMIDAGPQAAGYTSGMWTGPMVGDWIRRRFGVSYHNHYVPELLHQLGFSLQRPRKRLANADAEKQAQWVQVRFPDIKKKPLPSEAS